MNKLSRNKVPRIYHKQRNCQLGTVVIAVLITVGLSFTPFVDWANNVGGLIQGLLWGAVVLSHELENVKTKVSLVS
jgi:membrane associated rhomboid family serine protease